MIWAFNEYGMKVVIAKDEEITIIQRIILRSKKHEHQKNRNYNLGHDYLYVTNPKRKKQQENCVRI